MTRTLALFLLLCPIRFLVAQADWTARPWPADWITHPAAPATEFAVIDLRRDFRLTTLPDSLPVLVSADNRYQLFVNGVRVGEGPARGDLQHWRYARYDLRPYLREGDNRIEARVWNYGIDKPWAQQSYRLAFILQPTEGKFADLKTDGNWRTYHYRGYSPITTSRERLGTYIVVGPQLRIRPELDAAPRRWVPAKTITKGAPFGVGTEYYWALVPRQIPALPRRTPLPIYKVTANEERQSPTFPLTVPAGDSVLLDLRSIENFYPTLFAAGKKRGVLQLHYAESLFRADGDKGHRDSTVGKFFRGLYDELHLSGRDRDTLAPLVFRTGRYLQLVNPSSRDVRVDSLRLEPTGYPFVRRGSFRALTPEYAYLNDIYDVAWKTAELCALETYVDCPYYEQLQYVGDTRIQALISLYATGDDRLMRKAITTFRHSITPEGLVQSRYPSSVPQVIPPYALAWVEMVIDHYEHTQDLEFFGENLATVVSITEWFRTRRQPNGLVGPLPHWNFVDWTDNWPWDNDKRIGGVPNLENGSSILSWQYVSVLLRLRSLGFDPQMDIELPDYDDLIGDVAESILAECWQADRGLFSDTPAGKNFSQHANVLAVLNSYTMFCRSGDKCVGTEELLERIRTDSSLTRMSEYFRFFYGRAMLETNRGALYLRELQTWRDYLDRGHTTFPEEPGRTRSDCHAWSASPVYSLVTNIAGIYPNYSSQGGFRIEPARLPNLSYDAILPTVFGEIRVECRAEDGTNQYRVTAPRDQFVTVYLTDSYEGTRIEASHTRNLTLYLYDDD